MLIKDDVYKFTIWYIGQKKNKEKKIMYSDKADISALEDVPKTTYVIGCDYLNLKEHQVWWQSVCVYIVGDEITLEEAEKEIEALEKIKVDKKDSASCVTREATLDCLKTFCKNEKNNIRDENADKILINKNIDYDCDEISARITVIPSNNCKIISPSQIVKGRICPSERENDGYNSYIGLE